MKSVVVWVLAIANVILIASLIGRFTHADLANAQVQAQRRVSDYLMMPMELGAGQTGVVCVIDENSGQMAAVAYNGRNGLDVMPPLDLHGVGAPPANTGARSRNY